MQFLASHGQGKTGNDTIFGWFARYQAAAAAGADAVNGTVGALLNDDGTLAINTVVDEAIRRAPAAEFAAYAPLKGLPSFLDLAITLKLVNTGPSSKNLGSTPAPPLRRAVQGPSTWLPPTSLNAGKPSSSGTATGALMAGFLRAAALA